MNTVELWAARWKGKNVVKSRNNAVQDSPVAVGVYRLEPRPEACPAADL